MGGTWVRGIGGGGTGSTWVHGWEENKFFLTVLHENPISLSTTLAPVKMTGNLLVNYNI